MHITVFFHVTSEGGYKLTQGNFHISNIICKPYLLWFWDDTIYEYVESFILGLGLCVGDDLGLLEETQTEKLVRYAVGQFRPPPNRVQEILALQPFILRP